MSERSHMMDILSVSRAVPFEYHHENREFVFGKSTASPDDISCYGYPHSEDGGTPEEIEEWALSHSFLIHRHPISTAVGREAIESLWSADLSAETREVMVDVFAEQLGTVKVAERNRWLEINSLGAKKLQDGDFFVQTIGSCACYGVDYTVHERWRELGFSEYTPHNIERREQHASLLAGLGHIALIANRHINANR